MERYKSIVNEFQYDYYSELLEKTFDINKDVDIIYNLFFKKFLSNLKASEFREYDVQHFYKDNYRSNFWDTGSASRDDVLFGQISTNKLVEQDSKEANRVNPLIIYCGVFKEGSFYKGKVSTNNNPCIFISINTRALNLFFDKLLIKKSDLQVFKSEFTPQKIKSFIAHELSHWIDDSLHKGFLTSLLDLKDWLKNDEILLLKQKNVNTTYFEINAQIHAIKNLKRSNEKKWDEFTLDKVFSRYSPLFGIAKLLYSKYGKEVLEIWEKYLLKRMAREKLLGKNMNHFIEIDRVKESINLGYCTV